MAYRNSPGITIREFELFSGVQGVNSTPTGIVITSKWGELETPIVVNNVTQLIKSFNRPDDTNYENYLCAEKYLEYSKALWCVRAAHDAQTSVTLTNKLATTDTSTLVTVTQTAHGIASNSEVTLSGFTTAISGIPASQLNGVQVITSTGVDTYTFNVTTAANATAPTVGGTFSVSWGEKAMNATAEKYTGSGIAGQGILIKNDSVYAASYSNGGADVGQWCARHAGSLGNGLKVSYATTASFSQSLTCTSSGTALTGTGQSFTTKLAVGSIIVRSTGEARKIVSVTSDTAAVLDTAFATNLSGEVVTAKWEFYENFHVAPATSDWTANHDGHNDEIHLVVVDTTGKFSNGNVNTILESYSFLSVALDAVNGSNDIIYYKQAINDQSEYIRWLDHCPSGVNWGTEATGVTFTAVLKPQTFVLAGGKDGSLTLDNSDIMRGIDVFNSKEATPIFSIIAGKANSTIVDYLSALAERRQDLVVHTGPEKDDVVNNAGDERTDVLAFRNSIGSSTYVYFNDNWQLIYDRYAKVNRWIPCCGDTAGLSSKTDFEKDTWWAFDGFQRGILKGAIRLAWNPEESDREVLHPFGINSIFSKFGTGNVLLGSKTLVNRESPLGVVSVRKLFIFLEQSIANAAQKYLSEFNDPVTRNLFKSEIQNFLVGVRARRGTLWEKVICDETNNGDTEYAERRMVASILVKPNMPIKEILLNFVAMNNNTIKIEEIVL